MIDLYTVGDLKWLITLSVPHFPLLGEMTRVTRIERQIGNDAAIVSLLASRLGMQCLLFPTNIISRHDGQPLVDLLQRHGVDVSFIDMGGAVTPTTFCLSQVSSDERTWLVEDCAFHYNTDFDGPPDFTFAYLDLYEEHLEERLTLLHKWSKTNPRYLVNLSSSNLEEKVRRLSQFPFIDTIQMRGSNGIKEAQIWGRYVLQTCNVKASLITLGGLGAMLVDQHSEYFIEAEHIHPLRTIGAGASFAAGFIYALSLGATYREAAIEATRHAAGFCTSKENPLEAIKT
ncbi:MAG: hypothetical protein JOZ18_02570 [Chloroflexi bacterium]|nr:hypothetical protein [Chloroflexota bacterium]